MRKYVALVGMLFVLLATACGPRYVLDESKTLDQGVWTYSDSLQFEGNIVDTTKLYDIELEVQHTSEYAFQNLYVRIHTEFPSTKRLSQPLSLELADKMGRWQGKCGGNTCRLIVPIQHNAYFNEVGTYRFVLEQFMRQDTLPGITAMGIRIREVKSR